MLNNKLKIASISAEIDPYSKSGGLADVARSLPKALSRQGHEVIAITPFYNKVIDTKKFKLKKILKDLTVIIDDETLEKIDVWQGFLLENLPIYFIENEKYFSRKKELYGSSHENARFLLFNLAALKLLIKLRFKADIIHCHDWHTGLVPYFLNKDFKESEILKKAATIFTIHNLTFQFGHNWWGIPSAKRDNGRNGLPNFNNSKIETVNFAKRAILNADVINAVSETYAQEIMERDFGQDLHIILKNRKARVFGIVNGIDYKDYNPHNDPGLFKNYDWHNWEVKKKNKIHLQKKYGLPQDEKIPLMCMTSRIAEQKGFDLIRDIGDIMFRFNMQMIIMGDGDKKMISELKKIQRDHKQKLAYISFDSKMETSLYAASDFILLPSRFEPCGINQLKSMRYGCIPIARHVGGLIDTVNDYDPKHKTGNGFVFKIYDSRAMVVAITRALETFKRPDEWKSLVKKVMQHSYSWEYPARKYVELYQKALFIKQEKK